MTLLDAIPWALFGLSALGNALLIVKARRPKARQTVDITAQDLLHDLTRRGSAVLKVDVIDTANLLLRSPRR